MLSVDRIQYTSTSNTQIFSQATLEVVFSIDKVLRAHDIIKVHFPSQFDVSLPISCESFRDKSKAKWKTNKVIGKYKQKENKNYKIDCHTEGNVLVIDGLWSLMDPRVDTSTDESNSWLGFVIGPVVNPNEAYSGQNLLF